MSSAWNSTKPGQVPGAGSDYSPDHHDFLVTLLLLLLLSLVAAEARGTEGGSMGLQGLCEGAARMRDARGPPLTCLPHWLPQCWSCCGGGTSVCHSALRTSGNGLFLGTVRAGQLEEGACVWGGGCYPRSPPRGICSTRKLSKP